MSKLHVSQHHQFKKNWVTDCKFGLLHIVYIRISALLDLFEEISLPIQPIDLTKDFNWLQFDIWVYSYKCYSADISILFK